MTNQLMDHHHHSPAAFAKQTDMGASSVPSSAADVDAADAAADATATTVNSDKRRRHKWNRLTKDKLNRKRQKKLQTLVLRAQQRHRVEEQKQNQYKTTTISANSAAAVSGFSSVVGSTSNGSCSPSITSNNPMRTKNVLKQLKQTPQSAAPACSLLLMRPKQTNISSVVMEPVRRKQIELEQLKRKHPMSSFLLGRAQMPLWNLTYNSLSSFGKIAAQASLNRDGLAESHPSEPQLSKLDVVLTFNIEVIVMEVRGLRHLAPTREIYCTMEIEGSETGRLQTEHVQAKKPLWDTQGDFITNHPLPILKIKLYAINPSMLSLEDKELGKLVLRPTVLSPKTPEWCSMMPTSGSGSNHGAIGSSMGVGGLSGSDKSSGGMLDKSSGSNSGVGGGGGGMSSSGGAGSNNGGSSQDSPPNSGNLSNLNDPNQQDQLKIRVIVRMDRPQQLKHCGYLFGLGKSTWRKFKRRYHILIQVSQYTFVMCDFRDKKSKPAEMLPLDGYTVDYIEPPTDLIMEHCSEITSNESSSTFSSSSVHSTFGLAGRLAKPFLRSSNQSSNSSVISGGGDGFGYDQDSSDQHQHQPSAIQTAAALSDELHNKFYFNVVKEGDSVVFACDDEQECFGWVMALYRATGQAHKPTPLKNQYSSGSSHYIDAAFAYNAAASGQQQTKLVGSSFAVSSLLNGGTKKGGKCSVDVADQRARKHGMDEFISADPCKFQHNHLFKYLQNETLQYRLNDQYCSLGWLSPGQLFVLDEYCARYGVRTCFRHLAYLDSLLDLNQRGLFIDHTLLNYGYDFCASFVSGNSGQANPISSVNYDLRPDGIGTVTVEERDMFHVVKAKLLKMIERQIANFSHCFPFGKPDGALKATLSLLERVHMKEHQTNSMVQNEEVRALIRKCLEQAALNHYTKLSDQANLLQISQAKLQAAANMTAGVGANASGDFSPRATSSNDNTLGGAANSSALNNSGASTPLYGASPVPPLEQQDQPVATSLTSASGQFVENLFYGNRKRTQSNLSSSSVTSSSNYSTTSNNSNQQRSQDVFSPNDSIRRTHQVGMGHHQSLTNKSSSGPEQVLTMAMIINNDQIKPHNKLKYLICLAELCCEQVEENNEYFSDAFAWHSDLMLEHFELFWSLFSVDMDKILNELNNYQGSSMMGNATGSPMMSPIDKAIQMTGATTAARVGGPSGQRQSIISQTASSDLLGPTNRDSFVLFQILNNHMRKNSNFECRKFKTHLCEIYKPKLIRYIDIMESTLTRMVIKACERDSQINCHTMEQMFVRLDDLQRFVLYQLRWPDEQLAEQLHQRLKLIAYELCDACCQRTLQAFQISEKKSNKWTATTTSYSSPIDMIQMINLILDTRNRSLKLCTFNGFDQMSYHSKIDKLIETALGEMQPGLMGKMLNALDSTLNKLARYDEGNLLAPIFSLTSKQGMSSSGRDIGKQYVQFVSNCCDLLRHKINDELWIIILLEDWYSAQMNTICNWLCERLDHSLHEVQLSALGAIMPKIYADMSLQGLEEEKLNLKTYQTIMNRLQMEEASVSGSGLSSALSTSTGAGGVLAVGSSMLDHQQQQQQQQAQQQTSSSLFNTGGLLSSLTSSSSAALSINNNNSLIGSSSTGGPSSQASSMGTNLSMGTNRSQPISTAGSIRRPFGPGLAGSSNSASGSGSFTTSGSLSNSNNNASEADDENIVQSATRMFKGFWAS